MEVVCTTSTTSPPCKTPFPLDSFAPPSFSQRDRPPRNCTSPLHSSTPVLTLATQPWGYPSSPITLCALPSGARIAFIARHGKHHTHTPTAVPSRANIAALKHLGVRAILAFSAVGSLREEIRPGDFCLPTQIIDRTKGIRPASFFDGSVVAHAAFGDPVSGRLVRWLEEAVQTALDATPGGVALHRERCIVCMEGPQFSTRAESVMYRAWGGDLINMSVLPEAKLAREAEVGCVALSPWGWIHGCDCMRCSGRYALIATATDYDSWRPHSDVVTASQVLQTLQANANTSRLVAAAILQDLHDAVQSGLLNDEKGSMAYSIMPRSAAQQEEDVAKLAYILPEYFKPTPN